MILDLAVFTLGTLGGGCIGWILAQARQSPTPYEDAFHTIYDELHEQVAVYRQLNELRTNDNGDDDNDDDCD